WYNLYRVNLCLHRKWRPVRSEIMIKSTWNLVRFLVIAIGLLVLIALVMPLFILLFFFPLQYIPVEQEYFLPVVQNICFPAVALVIILAGLGRLHRYLVDKADAALGETGRARLKLSFTAIALLVVLAFAFSEYSKHQQRQVIADM